MLIPYLIFRLMGGRFTLDTPSDINPVVFTNPIVISGSLKKIKAYIHN